MNLDWQTIVALVIVVAAAAYLARTAWQTVARRKAAACAGGCASCPAGDSDPEVVGIANVAQDRDHTRPPATGKQHQPDGFGTTAH